MFLVSLRTKFDQSTEEIIVIEILGLNHCMNKHILHVFIN